MELKTYLVKRVCNISWCEDHSCVVMAYNELEAEREARVHSDDFRKAKLKITEIKEFGVVLFANTGA